jgi:hypothetical protein
MSIPATQPVRVGETVIELRQAIMQLNHQLQAVTAALAVIGALTPANAGTVVARVNSILSALETT